MSKKYRFLGVVAVLVLVSLACQTLGSSSSNGTTPQSTSSKVLFQDDFSDTSSGWDRVSDAEGINDYDNGEYRIFVNKANWYFWSNPGLNFSEVIIDVDGRKAGGGDENDYGVICRYKDEQNFYFFTISSDGYYGISKFLNGEESFVGMDQLQLNTNVIKGGESVNHITAECNGSDLTLIVNGTTLADVQDSTFSSGDVGLIAGTYDTPGTDIYFDNFTVTKP